MFVRVVFIIVLLRISVTAQTPYYFNYTVNDGLPGSVIFDIAQDSTGFIWFATNGGLCRFDGKRFLNFTTANGLNSNQIGAVAAYGDSILAGNTNNGVNIIFKNKAGNYTGEDPNIGVENILINDGEIYLHSRVSIHIIKNGYVKAVYGAGSKNAPLRGSIRHLFEIPGNGIFAVTNFGLLKLENESLYKTVIKGLNDSVFFSAAKYKNGFILSGYGKIYFIENFELVKTISFDVENRSAIQRVTADKKGNVWFIIPNKGLYFIENGTDTIVDFGLKLGLSTSQAIKVFEDKEENIWIATFGKGVWCISNTYISNYGLEEGLSNLNVYNIIKDRRGKIICGTFNGLNFFDENRFQTFLYNKNFILQTDYIFNIAEYDNTVFCGGTYPITGKLFYTASFRGRDLYLFNKPSLLKAGNRYFLGSWLNLVYCYDDLAKTPETTIVVIGDSLRSNRINCIFLNSENMLWVGSSLGACCITEGKKTLFINDKVLGASIKTITEDRDGNVWLAGDNGAAKVNVSGSVLFSGSKLGDYDITSSNALTVDSSGRIWLGTNKGLFLIKNDSVKRFDNTTGLPSDEIYSLLYDDGRKVLWVGSNKGLTEFNLNDFENSERYPIPVVIESITAGDSVYYEFGNLEFESNQNNIRLDFAALSYSMPNGMEYEYTINNSRQTTINNFLDLTSLKYGYYNIKIRAKAPNSKWSDPAEINFYIKPRFAETDWFGFLVFLLVLSAAASTGYLRIRTIRNREEEKRLINERISRLKHKALSAMMNPHFIFNSLNAVQHLVNTGKLMQVNKYISRLALLIRKNLDYSDKSYILLEEEIYRLKIYLDIENLRFSNKFTYDVIVDEKLDTAQTLIPNMIIQPFVENSLWHGIMPLKKEGELIISFNLEKIEYSGADYQFLTIKIRDNGLGINPSRKKEGYESKGIKLVEERLKLLSEVINIKSPIIVEDLSIGGENTTGTEVTISLPPHLYKIS